MPRFSVFVRTCKTYSFLCDAVLTAKLVPPKRREQKQEQPKCLASCCRAVLNSGLVHTHVFFFSIPNVAFSTALWPLIRTQIMVFRLLKTQLLENSSLLLLCGQETRVCWLFDVTFCTQHLFARPSPPDATADKWQTEPK